MIEGQKVFIVISLYICGKLEKNVENIYKRRPSALFYTPEGFWVVESGSVSAKAQD